MKILYSCLSQSWGGLEMRTIQGAEQLLKKNISVEILCYPGSPINKEAEEKGITVILLKASGYFNPVQIINLAKILKKNSFSLIHTQFSKDLWTIVPALKFIESDIPLLLSKRMESSVVKKDFLHKQLYNRVNFILAISNIIKQNVIETCPVSGDKVLLHFNGVDLNKFVPQIANRKKIRNEFNINEKEIVIGILSRITFGKGYEEIIQAAEILLKKYSDLKFLLVGEASSNEKEYENKIKNMVKELSIEDKVIFTGFRNDTVDLLSAFDIFVFPSHAESFGNALIEAMAMEKPSVAANSHGVLDITVDGDTGYLFMNKDSESLAEKIEILISSPEKREKMGKASRERVKEYFNIDKQTDWLINFYSKLI